MNTTTLIRSRQLGLALATVFATGATTLAMIENPALCRALLIAGRKSRPRARRGRMPAPLNADLSCYDRFRLHFASSDLPLNINVEVKSASSPAVYQCGVNTPVNQLDGFDVDFEFENFVTNDPEKPPADWTDIDRVLLLIQNPSQVAANDYASPASRWWHPSRTRRSPAPSRAETHTATRLGQPSRVDGRQ